MNRNLLCIRCAQRVLFLGNKGEIHLEKFGSLSKKIKVYGNRCRISNGQETITRYVSDSIGYQGELMKKTFNILLPLLALILGYLIYLQWFSPSKPVQLHMALDNVIPSSLASLPVLDENGKETVIPIQDESVSHTLILVDAMMEKDRNFYFSAFKNFHELLTKRGYRIVYLWMGADVQDSGLKQLAALVGNDRFATHAVMGIREAAQYQKLGLQITEFPLAFVYDSKGTLLGQQQGLLGNQVMEFLTALESKEAASR